MFENPQMLNLECVIILYIHLYKYSYRLLKQKGNLDTKTFDKIWKIEHLIRLSKRHIVTAMGCLLRTSVLKQIQ